MSTPLVWSPEGLVEARGFWTRLRGATFRQVPILIPGRSVHSLWIRRALWAVAIDAGRRVTHVRCLQPLRIVRFPATTRWVLELPEGDTPPAIGTIIGTG